MHMDVMSNQGKDDTLEPAYFRNRLLGSGGGSSDEQLVIEVNRLKARMNTIESSDTQQNTKITRLETTQQQQDNRMDTIEENVEEAKNFAFSIVGDTIPASATETPAAFAAWLKEKGWDLKDLANTAGGVQTIVNYMSGIIGIEIPSSIKDDPDAILAWLESYNEDKGLDLKDLENRINDIETNLLTDDDIGDIVGGLP